RGFVVSAEPFGLCQIKVAPRAAALRSTHWRAAMSAPITHLDSPAASSEDGFELLDACHRQALFTLGKLAALVSRLRDHGVDEEARALAAEVLSFFDGASRAHHEDEERHVFPRLLAGVDEELIQAVQRLQQDHRWIEEDWLELRAPIDAIASGQ